MEFKPFVNEDFTERVDTAFGRLAELKRGDIFPYAEITQLTGIPRNDERFPRVCASLKKRSVRKLKTVLEAVANVGYRLLTEDEQIRIAPLKRSSRAERQLFRAVREVACVPTDSVYLRVVQNFNVEKFRKAKRDVTAARRMTQVLWEPTQTLPVRPKSDHRNKSSDSTASATCNSAGSV